MTHRAVSTTRPQGRKRAWMVLSTLVFLALLSVLIACVVGSIALPLQDVMSAMRELTQGTTSTMAATLVDLRLSRALSAFVTGATLALAGVIMQA